MCSIDSLSCSDQKLIEMDMCHHWNPTAQTDEPRRIKWIYTWFKDSFASQPARAPSIDTVLHTRPEDLTSHSCVCPFVLFSLICHEQCSFCIFYICSPHPCFNIFFHTALQNIFIGKFHKHCYCSLDSLAITGYFFLAVYINKQKMMFCQCRIFDSVDLA